MRVANSGLSTWRRYPTPLRPSLVRRTPAPACAVCDSLPGRRAAQNRQLCARPGKQPVGLGGSGWCWSGVDTPETKHPVKGVECFGPEASAFTTEHLLGRVIRLESDVVRRDVYDRRLAYVSVHGRRFNDVLVERGYARFLVIPPNTLHARDLLIEELEARRARRGLWGEC